MRLTDLPTEVLEDIVARLPSLKPTAETSILLRSVSLSPHTKRAWIYDWFMEYYDANWEFLLNDALVWDRLSVCFRGTEEYAGVNRLMVKACREVSSTVVRNAEAVEILRQDGMFRSLLGACPPSLTATWHPGQRSSQRCIDGESYWTSAFYFACFYGLLDAASFCLEVLEEILDAKSLHGILEDALENAAMGGAQPIVTVLRSKGYCIHWETGLDRVVEWCADLLEILDDACLSQLDPPDLSSLDCVLDAFTPAPTECGLHIWDFVLHAGIGNKRIMESCLVRANRKTTPDLLAETNAYLTNHPPHPMTSTYLSALSIIQSLTDHSAATTTLDTLSTVSELHHSETLTRLLHMAPATPFLLQYIKYIPQKDILDTVLLTCNENLLIHHLKVATWDLTALSRTLLTATLHTTPSYPRNTPSHIASIQKGLAIFEKHGAMIKVAGSIGLGYAAEFGNLWMVKWLHERGVNATDGAYRRAVGAWKEGRIGYEVVEFLGKLSV
ncbi:hypothetical protein SpCBS45565_g04007 [Spizellomyces sp. 'palustris']|nr:hypothetical protein SpCBS45565_g04007 [Spizellomyces sp. 'palustris']